MTKEAKREYNRTWMAFRREAQRRAKLVAEGKCLHCEILIREAPGHDCLKPVDLLQEDLYTPQNIAH